MTTANSGSTNLRCNVFAGSDIGYLKGISFQTKTFRNLNTIEKLNKKMGISCLCWGSEDESIIYAGCRGGDLIHHDTKSGMSQFVLLEHSNTQDEDKQFDLKEICLHENKLFTAFHNGSVYVHEIEMEDSLVITSEVDNLQSLLGKTDGNLTCMDHNKSMTHMIATGGQENPLRIWDINNLSDAPIFTAKNVRNDWLNLRVPVWVTKAKFYSSSSKVITGTGNGTVRMYDPSVEQRRPVIEVNCGEYPVTALEVRPNSDYQVFVGNTIGTLVSVDLRNKSILRGFKGNKGGITDIKCHPKYPVFSVSSIDRYVRCYDPDQKASLIHSFYVNSSLNCILFSSQWEKKDYGNDCKNSAEKDQKEESNSKKNKQNVSDDEDEEGEDVWNKMKVVETKKRRLT